MEEKFKIIAVFQYSSEAQIMKARLEVEGITVFLQDQFTIDTDPLVSNAIGGIKLKVWQEDEAKALEILNSISEYSLDNTGQEIECPNCGSEKIELTTTVRGFKSMFFFLFSFLTAALPIYTKYNYRCNTCNENFNLDEH